jgi:hypothetical protein
MERKTQRSGFGVLVLAGLLIFAACKQPGDDTRSPTGQIEITGIDLKVKGKDSYKIFVQFSEGTNANAGYVAKGDAEINGKTSVTIDLYGSDDKPWNGTGTFSMAMTLSPATVTSENDIDVWGNMDVPLSAENKSFKWAKGFHVNDWDISRVKQIYDGGDSGKPGIICVEKSGIIYPGKSPSP